MKTDDLWSKREGWWFSFKYANLQWKMSYEYSAQICGNCYYSSWEAMSTWIVRLKKKKNILSTSWIYNLIDSKFTFLLPELSEICWVVRVFINSIECLFVGKFMQILQNNIIHEISKYETRTCWGNDIL